MKNYHNIDKSGFHKGQYVGYANGVWSIVKSDGKWIARLMDGVRETKALPIITTTLSEMSAELDRLS